MTCPHEIKLGTPQTCPKCNGQNPSGLDLPRECIWCKFEQKPMPPEFSKTVDKHFWRLIYPVWYQPAGGHDAWALGSRCEWPEDSGTIWESTIPDNTTEPGTLEQWGYWVEVA